MGRLSLEALVRTKDLKSRTSLMLNRTTPTSCTCALGQAGFTELHVG